MSNWRHQGRSLAKKYQTMASFGTRFWGVRGILPCTEANHTHLSYINELQILHSLCIPRHGFATAVKGAISEQLCDRVGCAFPIYPVQGVRAAGLQLALIFYAGMWNSWYINYTTFAVNTVSLSSMSTWRHQRAFIGEKVFGPVLEGHGASRPARRQITHTNHISMNYKYCIVCACQSMTSPLQSKVQP